MLLYPFARWTKNLVTKLAQDGEQKLTIRLQGPYADPPASLGQPDGVILVAGEPWSTTTRTHHPPLYACVGTVIDHCACRRAMC